MTYEAAQVGAIPGWWCRPEEVQVGAAILYLHGGAYVLGSAAAYRNFAGQIAVQAKAPVFVADYPLAPERPFPAAMEDARAGSRSRATRPAEVSHSRCSRQSRWKHARTSCRQR